MKTKKSTTKNVGLDELVKQVTDTLDRVEAALGTAPAITAEQKMRTSKPRKGAERVLPQIAALASAHGLDSRALHTADMAQHLEAASALDPLVQRLGRAMKRIDDQRFVASGAAWQMGLQFYGLLQRRAATDGELAESLAPIEAFFAYRHNRVLETKPTKLETRAKAQLAHAERLVSRARPRVGTSAPAPQSVPSQMLAMAKSNDAVNEYVNGTNSASNGAVNAGGE